jgi:Ca-activated chloride channel homolog
MRYVVILMLGLVLTDPIKIRKINSAKAEAKNAFQSGDYAKAVATYRYLIDSLGVNEDEVLLNLAHAYYLQKDTANAYPNYQSLMSSSKGSIASKANLHVGLMANQRGKAEEALNLFKQAVKSDPTNEEARYNYEMLKKKLDEQKKKEQEQQQRDQQNKDQDQKQDQQNKDQQQKDKEQQKKEQEQQKKEQEEKQKQEQEKKEQEQKEKEQQEKQEQQEQEQKEAKEKKEKPNFDETKMPKITEEKARMILEAMKNQEKQYLQQNKRKATKSRDRTKPDW